MTAHYDHILIFKSNIRTEGDKDMVSMAFNNHPLVEEWCVDLDDEERILRVVSAKLTKKQVIDLVNVCGYSCEELQD